MEHTRIKTDRLILRKPLETDAQAIADAVGVLDVSQWLTSVVHPYSVQDAEDYIQRILSDEIKNTYLVENETGLVGCIGIGPELGYWFAQSEWGKGYATEAAHAVLDAYFAQSFAPPVASGYIAGNGRSKNVLTKLGFGHTGIVNKTVSQARQSSVDVCKMVLTAEQWHALNPWQIKTPRLMMRPLRPSDAPVVADIGGTRAVAPMILSATVPWPIEKVEHWIEQSRWRGTLGVRFAIECQGKLVGVVGLGRGANPKTAATMYFLDPAHWGQGIATEAMSHLMGAAFERFDISKIDADVYDDNPASARVLEKLGFAKVGATTDCKSSARVEPAPVSLYRLSRAAHSQCTTHKARP